MQTARKIQPLVKAVFKINIA